MPDVVAADEGTLDRHSDKNAPIVTCPLCAAATWLALMLLLALLAGLVLPRDWSATFEFLIVFAIGAATGATELVGRYREQPIAALLTPGATIYVFINAFAAAAALALIRASTTLAAAIGDGAIQQILWASFGAMAFFRSALFKARLGNDEVPIGPAILFDGLLNAADLDANRRLALNRFEFASATMRDVDFLKASAEAPSLCFQAMQNFPKDQQDVIVLKVGELQALIVDERQKSVILALMLTLWFGREVVKRVVDVNRDHWRPAPAPAPPAAASASNGRRDALIKEAAASRR
jgi:hypothetical protein